MKKNIITLSAAIFMFTIFLALQSYKYFNSITGLDNIDNSLKEISKSLDNIAKEDNNIENKLNKLLEKNEKKY